MKKTITLLLALLMMLSLAACESILTSSGQSHNTQTSSGPSHNTPTTMTLKQFLDSGPKVAFCDVLPLDKDDKPKRMYLFEGGKVFLVEDAEVIYNGLNYKTENHLKTYSEFAKMTDDEILAYAREHVKTSKVPQDMVQYDRNYSLHIYTDNTGNNLKYERIEYETVREIKVEGENGLYVGTGEWERYTSSIEYFDLTTIRSAVIYDSFFMGPAQIFKNGDAGLFFRVGDGVKITLDHIGDEGVEID